MYGKITLEKLDKYKKKVNRIVEEKGMSSIMNNTKWRELKKGINELDFYPPFRIKSVDENERADHKFDEDDYNACDWGMELDNYLGGDIYATPFFAVEWIKIRPRLLIEQGLLVDPKVIDETEEFIAVLEKYNIPYVEDHNTFIIYGYR